MNEAQKELKRATEAIKEAFKETQAKPKTSKTGNDNTNSKNVAVASGI